MPHNHRRLRSQPLRNGTNKQQPRRALVTTLLAPEQIPQHPQQHRVWCIQHARILAQHRRRRQRIQRHGTIKPFFIRHQRPQEMHRAVVQRAVIGMVADAVLVEGDEDVDGGGGRLLGVLLRGAV